MAAQRLRAATKSEETLPSLPWGRGWTAAGAFSSRRGPGLRPPEVAYAPELQRRSGSCPQAGEGVPGKSSKKKAFYGPEAMSPVLFETLHCNTVKSSFFSKVF